MGHTIWVEIDGHPLEETSDDNSTMHRLMENLDQLAEKLGVQKLSEFYDFSELEEAYGDLAFEADDPGISEDNPSDGPSIEDRQATGDWFDSTAGLTSARHLRQHLTEHFDDLAFTPEPSTAHWPEQLMDELAYIENMLHQAVTKGRRFRLLIVP